MSKVDLAILGGGNGGYAAALRGAQLGLSVALIENDKVGGTCLHLGCIPTKALLHSAEVAEEVRSAGDFGVLTSDPQVDWGKVLSYKDSVVGKHFKGLQGLIKSRKIQMVQGKGRVSSASTIDVEGAGQVEAGKVVLATGSYPRELPFVKTDGQVFVTSDHCLSAGDLPSSVIIIGAGAVGLEFASIYRSFGADVTILEALPRLAPGEDEDVSKELEKQFSKRGIKSFTGVKVTGAEISAGQAEVSFEGPGGKPGKVKAERCLVAIGRAPRSDGLGYEDAGVKVERGFVVTDEHCRTGVEGVYAIGDLIAQPSSGLPFPHFQLAHVAFAEGVHVAEQAAGGGETPALDLLGVPRATYSRPEMASVGLTEKQAKDAGEEVSTAKFNWAASGRASILGEAAGFVKVVAGKQGRILGVHMIGPRVTELIAEAQLITNWEALAGDVAPLVHPHPTLSEALGEAMLKLSGRPLHMS